MSDEATKNPLDTKSLLRNFLIELAVYGVLVVIYFFAVLRLLNGLLTDLFDNSLVTYAILGLILILAQGVLLDALTSFLLDQIKLRRSDKE